jgi:hypothetical protein
MLVLLSLFLRVFTGGNFGSFQASKLSIKNLGKRKVYIEWKKFKKGQAEKLRSGNRIMKLGPNQKEKVGKIIKFIP